MQSAQKFADVEAVGKHSTTLMPSSSWKYLTIPIAFNKKKDGRGDQIRNHSTRVGVVQK